MPRLNRAVPLYRQIAEHYKRLIVTGELASKAPLPSVRVIAREWHTGPNVAQHALDFLKTEGLAHAVPGVGTFVNGNRAKLGPQQRMRAATFPVSERVEVRAAEIIPSPGYVVPLLGLEPDEDGVTRVLRREWVTFEGGDVPFMLSVSWHGPQAAVAVPELLTLLPPPAPMAAVTIAERTGHEEPWMDLWFEARPVKDDGREGPLLRLPKDAHCQAVTYTVTSGEDVLEYGEFVLLEGRVINVDMEP